MGILDDVRAKYPQYKDVPDQQLADGLYKKFYADKMSREDFDGKLSAKASQPAAPAAQAEQKPGSDMGHTTRLVGNLGAGTSEAAAKALGAPVDLVTSGINAASRGVGSLMGVQNPPQISNPIGGSESIKKAFGIVGANPDQFPQVTQGDRTMRAAGNVAGDVAMGAMGMRGFGGPGTYAMNPEGKVALKDMATELGKAGTKVGVGSALKGMGVPYADLFFDLNAFKNAGNAGKAGQRFLQSFRTKMPNVNRSMTEGEATTLSNIGRPAPAPSLPTMNPGDAGSVANYLRSKGMDDATIQQLLGGGR